MFTVTPKHINNVHLNAAQTNELLNILKLGNQQIARGKLIEAANAVARVRFNHHIKPAAPQPQKT